MKRALIYSPLAIRDIERLYGFLKSKSPDAARRAVLAIRQSLTMLGEQPEAGRRPEGAGEGLREWLIPFGQAGYVALYRVLPDKVIILTLRHMSEAGY